MKEAPSLPEACDTVLLDVGNTLLGLDMALIGEWLAERGFETAEEDLLRAECAARPAVSEFLLGGASTESCSTRDVYSRAFLAHLLGDELARDPRLPTALSKWFRSPAIQEVVWSRRLPGVPEALAILKSAGLTLVVVSNSDGRVAERLRAGGLLDLFDVVVDSTEVGVEKPDPRIFRIALDAVGGQPASAVHAGDIYAVDVVGAEGAGVTGILVDPYGYGASFPCLRFPGLPEVADALLRPRSKP